MTRFLTPSLDIGLALNLCVVCVSRRWFQQPIGSEMYCDTFATDTVWFGLTGFWGGLPCAFVEFVVFCFRRQGKRMIAPFVGMLLNVAPVFLAQWLNNLAISVRHLQTAA